MPSAQLLQVAVGIVSNAHGEILVALRPSDKHQGGLWEFPGGKVHNDESIARATARELHEELGIEVLASTPLLSIRHQYPDLGVQLHVRRVDAYTGLAHGREGQEIRWVKATELHQLPFPAANVPIIAAVNLPDYYAIMDASILDTTAPSVETLVAYLQQLLQQGITLIQVRLKQLPAPVLQAFLQQAQELCALKAAQLLLNSELPGAFTTGHGLHLSSRMLMQLQQRPDNPGWIAASCHTLAELQHAADLGLDFAVLAPVLPTLTHPGTASLGWAQFAALVEHINIPVYALGGMQHSDLTLAKHAGAQGIAGIRLFLS